MEDVDPIDLVEEATLEFSLGDENELLQVVDLAPDCLDAWRALAEVRLALADFPGAHAACLKALELDPKDLTAKVSLSRILVSMGDKEGAEKATAEARILGWQEELSGEN